MFQIRLLVLALAIAAPPIPAVERLPKPDRLAAAPTPAQAVLIREGIALNDQQNYESAIAKYRQVLAKIPGK